MGGEGPVNVINMGKNSTRALSFLYMKGHTRENPINLTNVVNASAISSVQLLSCVRLFATPWTAAHQASLSITNSWSLLKFMSIKLVMPSSVVPFSFCLQSFPASESFPMSQFFASGGQSIGVSASASVFPMNIQD